MAITNFIPTIWSENLYEELDKQYIAVSNCNRDFEGDIKNKGSVVKICGVGEVNVSDYTKNTDMSAPQLLSDTVKELSIDQAKYFNFQIDDIDRAQCSPKLMTSAMKIAASALANEADKYIFGLYTEAGKRINAGVVTEEEIFHHIVKAITTLRENNVTEAQEAVIEIPPAVAALIIKAKINLAIDSSEALETGCIGKIMGCKVFVSNNVKTSDEGDTNMFYCYVRTKRAIAFAEQLSEIEAYRPEKRFSDAVKGLHLYGAKVVYPNELVTICMNVLKD